MSTEFKELVEQLNTANTELKNLRDTQAKEVKELGEANAETKQALEAAEQKNQEIQDNFAKMNEKLVEMETQQKRMRDTGFNGQRKTMGAQFIESELYTNELKSGTGFGKRQEVKDISNLAASAGALVDTYRDPEVYRSVGGRRQLRVRDLLPSISVDSNAVEIMRYASVTDNAAPQQPTSANTAIGAGEFQTKAESNYTWELVTVPVRTMAHFVPASRQVLTDAPMLQGLIDSELNYGLQLLSDDEILNGDGTNQHLTGILNDASINDVGELATGTAADDVPAAMIEHIRAAITECQKNEYYDINGLLLNPADWQTLETAKATDGHYLLVAFAATSGETPTVWRVPVIVTNAIPVSTFLLGDWSIGAKLYVREGVSIRVAEQHASLFTQNAVAILAEERYCIGVNLPLAFCKGAFTVAAA